jgi:hypothetical protein
MFASEVLRQMFNLLSARRTTTRKCGPGPIRIGFTQKSLIIVPGRLVSPMMTTERIKTVCYPSACNAGTVYIALKHGGIEMSETCESKSPCLPSENGRMDKILYSQPG